MAKKRIKKVLEDRKKGYLYYIDGEGYLCKTKMKRK